MPRSSALTFAASVGVDYTDTAAEIAFTMTPGVQYRLYVNSDAWFTITPPGGTGAAKAGAGSHPIAAKTSVLVSAIAAGTRISVVQDSANGHATLSEIATVVSS